MNRLPNGKTNVRFKKLIRYTLLYRAIRSCMLSAPLFGLSLSAHATVTIGSSTTSQTLSTDSNYLVNAGTVITSSLGPATLEITGIAPVTLTNSGSITQTSGSNSAVRFTIEGSLINQSTGLITGNTYGVAMAAASGVNNNVTNYGDISGTSSYGINYRSGGGTVDNFGTINGNIGSSTTSVGIAVTGTSTGATINNHAGASILTGIGNTFYPSAIQLEVGSSTVNNDGLLNGYLFGINTLAATGVTTVTNSVTGQIQGSSNAGINLQSNSFITNSGSISSTSGSGILLSGSNNSVINSGTIIGLGGNAINIVGNNNAITLDTGSSLTGDINSSGTGNTLTLQNAGSVASNMIGLNSLSMIGSSWTLSGNATFTGSGNSVIAVNNGALIVTGTLIAVGTTVASGATLQLGNGGTLGDVVTGLHVNGNLIVNHSNTYFYTDPIDGTGSFTQQGTGTTILTGASTFTGGTVVNHGTLQLGNNPASQYTGAGLLVGEITVNSGATLLLNGSDVLGYSSPTNSVRTINLNSSTLTHAGNDTNGWGVTYNLAGALMQTTGSGNFSFGGGTTVNTLASTNSSEIAGLVTIYDSNPGNAAVFNVANGAAGIDLLVSANVNEESGSYGIAKLGDGLMALTGTATYTGGTTISGGTLQIGNGGTTGSILGSVVDNSILAFNRSNALTFSNIVSGSGVLTQAGSGTLTLSGVNTYSGGTHLDAGILSVGADNNLGAAAGELTFNGGALRFSSGFTSGRAVTLNSAGSIDTQANTNTLSGVISGVGALIKQGAGTLILAGENNYSGGTTISAGTLQIGNGATAGSITGNVTGANGTLAFNRSDIFGFSGSINTQSLVQQGTGTLTLTGTGSSVNAASVTSGILNLAQAGVFSTTGGYSTSGNATTSISSGSTLNVGGLFTQAANSTLSIDLGSSTPITSGTASLGGTLAISGLVTSQASSASALAAIQQTIIHTAGANGISGDFTNFNLGGTTTVDYLRLIGSKANSDQDYNVGLSLAWFSPLPVSSGTFTLTNPGDVFNVDVVLNDQLANPTASWDGIGLTKNGAGTLILSALNTYTGDTTINAGTLQIGTGALTGGVTGDIINNGALVFNQNGNSTYAGQITGSGGLTKSGTGSLTLSAANAYTGDTQINAGILQLNNAAAAGSGGVAIANSALLDLALSNGTFANVLSGSGNTLLSGSNVAISGVNGGYTGNWDITGSATITQAANLGSGAVNLDGGLSINPMASGSYSFANVLTGNGTLTVGMFSATDAFNFALSAGANFGGTVALGNSQFALSGVNTLALTDATLKLNSGNTTVVGSGTQAIGNLTLNGGTLNFGLNDLSASTVTARIATDNLDISATPGNIQINTSGLSTLASSTTNLLKQDDQTLGLKMISANTVTGNVSDLQLIDQNGVAITAAQIGDVIEGSDVVAKASYNIGLNTGSGNDGLYVSYGLTQLDLQNNQTLHLNASAGATGSAAELSVRVIGLGNLDVNASSAVGQTISINNATNGYTGATTVSAGTLSIGSNNALGATSALSLAANTGLLLNGHSQTIGSFNDTSTSTTNLGGGSLTISNGGQSSGVLTGSGALNLTGGTLTMNAANSGLSAAVNLHGGNATLNNIAGFGSGNIDIASANSLTLAVASAATLTNALSGAGLIVKTGTGNLTIATANSRTGATQVNNGTLILSNAGGVGSGGIAVASGSELDLTFNSATFANALTGSGNTSLSGSGVTISGANSGYSGNWDIASTGSATIRQAANLGSGAVNLDGGLSINPTAAGSYSFANKLTGDGTLTVGMFSATDAFNFALSAGVDFGGTVALGNSQFALSGVNTLALTDATLKLNSGNTTVVGSGTQAIGNLNLNGGTLVFDISVPGDTDPAGMITTGNLDLNGGKVQMTTSGLTPGVGSTYLIEQDNGNLQSQLIAAASVTGSVGNLTLIDQNGADVDVNGAQIINVTEGANLVAKASYSFGLQTGTNNDGLYLSYGLTQLDLQSGQTLHLNTAAGATGSAAQLTARLIGSGNLDVNASAAAGQTISINNATNGYTGATNVSAGTLSLGSNNALGATSALSLTANTGLLLNGHSQTIGSFNDTATSTTSLGGGSLTIGNGGQSSGVLTGSGALNLTGGTLALNAANGGLSAAVNLNGGNATLNNIAGFGSGNINIATASNLTLAVASAATLANSLSGTGNVTVQTNGATLSGNNSGFAGRFTVNSGANLIAGVANHLGTASVANAGTLTINSSTNWTLANALSGAGALVKTGTGNLTIATANSRTGATQVNNGTLTLSNTGGVGSGGIAIASGSELDLTFNSATFANALTGSGNTSLSGSGVTISGANSGYSGNWDIASTGSATIRQAANLGSGAVNLDGGLSINPTAAGSYSFANKLTGDGTLTVGMFSATDAFNFALSAGVDFGGTVALGNSQFALSGVNTLALTDATLKLNSGNTTVVGSGTQAIGNLNLNGGTLNFNVSLPGNGTPVSSITTGDLALNGGKVQVNVTNTGFVNPNPLPSGLSLLEQDDANLLTKIVSASSVTGSAGNLQLVDQSGNPVGSPKIINVTEGGNIVAVASYNFGLSSGTNNDGLYINDGLTQLDLQSGQTLHLAAGAGATGNAAALKALLIGSGSLDVNASAAAGQTVTLSNSNNGYTGLTSVSAGTLALGTNNALGVTSGLTLAAASGLALNGHSQTVGGVSDTATSNISLGGGSLTISNGGQINGGLTGSGLLNLTGGTLTVNAANSGLNATVNLHGGNATLNNLSGFGSGNVDIATANSLTLAATGAATLANRLSGAGNVIVQTNGATLTGNSSGFAGNFTVNSGANLIAGVANNLGTASVANAGTLTINSATNWTLANALSGAGALVKTGTGNLTISTANGMTGTTQVNNGTLTLSNAGGVGGGAIDIDSAGVLNLNVGTTSFGNAINNDGQLQITGNTLQLNSVLTGVGSTLVSGTNLSITGLNGGYSGNWTIANAGSAYITQSANLGSGDVLLNGRLTLDPTVAGNFTFINTLAGHGTLAADLSSVTDIFRFASGVSAGFNGTLEMVTGQFELNAASDAAMANATLKLDAGGSSLLADNRTIGGLSFNGGTLSANMTGFNNDGVLSVNRLDTIAGGTLAAGVPTDYPNPSGVMPEANDNFFDQDDNILLQVVAASGTVTGVGSQLALTAQDGSPVGAGYEINIHSGNNITSPITAIASYDYTANVRSNGLWIGFNLQQLDIQTGQTLVLENSSATDNALGAKITGSGNLNVLAVGTATLANAANDYTGVTTVDSGTLRLGTNNSLGHTQSVALTTGGVGLDLNGVSQSVGALNSAVGTLFNFNGGTFTIDGALRSAGSTDGGMISGQLIGSGEFIIDPSIVSIDGANSTLSVTTTLSSGSEVRLNDAQSLGSGGINLTATNAILSLITFNGKSVAGNFVNAINGSGNVVLGSGTNVNITGANAGFSGIYSIDSGAAMTVSQSENLGSAAVIDNGHFTVANGSNWTFTNALTGSGDFVKAGSGELLVNQLGHTGTSVVDSGALIIGDATMSGATLGASGAGDVAVNSGGTLAGTGSVTGNVMNHGTISALNALGNYSSASASNLTLLGTLNNSGTVVLAGSQVGNTLTVNGHYTGNNGTVELNSVLGGDNSKSDKLVLLGGSSGSTNLRVNNLGGRGAPTTEGIQVVSVSGGASDGRFSLSNPVVAGSYEYRLYLGSASQPTDGNWYLRSVTGDGPVPNPVPGLLLRPEIGAYLGNQMVAQTMFLHTFKDRQGEQARTGGSDEESSIWGRIVNDHIDSEAADGVIDQKTNTTLVQLGGDVGRWSSNGSDLLKVGVMGGIGQSKTDVHADGNSAKANGQVDGYSVGVYGTWFADDKTRTGAYVDSWMQYGWYNNKVNRKGLAEENYNSQTMTTSVETGYGFELAKYGSNQWILEPQVQAIYINYNSDDITEDNGTQVAQQGGNNNLITRTGLRLIGNITPNGAAIQPFAEVNWWNGKVANTIAFDGQSQHDDVPNNRFEAKVGLQGNLSKNLQMWGNVSGQTGDNGYRSYAGLVGVKYNW
ncbi:autotransporter outer membrane beta-barrel domain-containing protein [Budvicia diplopodorum]|uniref:autotransporter outer membrane beta-barrel domain-containing protein n=1 Tax=Budvicia diplopodorum TaxID=1119056 RepID=UPI00135775A5|nr:autotransporter outer membrane beta-barrel domain-containing protein [Budvicia diplopodorum]